MKLDIYKTSFSWLTTFCVMLRQLQQQQCHTENKVIAHFMFCDHKMCFSFYSRSRLYSSLK